jgi:hypothetical protein
MINFFEILKIYFFFINNKMRSYKSKKRSYKKKSKRSYKKKNSYIKRCKSKTKFYKKSKSKIKLYKKSKLRGGDLLDDLQNYEERLNEEERQKKIEEYNKNKYKKLKNLL